MHRSMCSERVETELLRTDDRLANCATHRGVFVTSIAPTCHTDCQLLCAQLACQRSVDQIREKKADADIIGRPHVQR